MQPVRQKAVAGYIRKPKPTSKCFQRDRDRIIHSTAFRRLKHKTQVFISPLGDHFRTRLTQHRGGANAGVARSLGLDEDLTEALALAHDFGHPPFGHAGEVALDSVMPLRISITTNRRCGFWCGSNSDTQRSMDLT